MSMLTVHRTLIVAGIVFCVGYAFWEFGLLGRGGASPLLGAVFLALAAGLSFYLTRLTRFLGYRKPPPGHSRPG